jgi:beta-glucosidase
VAGDGFEAAVRVTNSGATEGAEVVQLYVGLPDSRVDRPSKLLKGFQKVWLKPGEAREGTIAVDAAELSYFDERTGSWAFEPGTYRVFVGPSSDEGQLLSGEAVLGTR